MTNEEVMQLMTDMGLHEGGMDDWLVDNAWVMFANAVAKHTLANIDPSSFMSWQEGYEAGKQTKRKPLTDEEERKAFEQWYVCNAFDYERNPIGSRECGLQWSAWKARAAHGIKEEK